MSGMSRYLTLDEVMSLHRQILKQSGGTAGVRDLGSLKSAIAQPMMTFAVQLHRYAAYATESLVRAQPEIICQRLRLIIVRFW